MPDTFVFDCDDTLWMNEWQYSEAYADFFSYLYKIFGNLSPNLHYIRARYFEIEGELYKTWGIRRGRVARAMIQTYRDVCTWIHWRHNKVVRRVAHEIRIQKIGDQPFDHTRLQWLPGAPETLTVLRNQGHKLCALSCYDNDAFLERAQFLRFYEYFDPKHVRLIEFRKTANDFMAASGWAENRHQYLLWYAVGNGENDILPALEIDECWRGIYIPHGSTSKYFNEGGQVNHFSPPPLEHPRVTTIRSMQDFFSALPPENKYQ